MGSHFRNKTMKLIIFTLATVAVVFGAPQTSRQARQHVEDIPVAPAYKIKAPEYVRQVAFAVEGIPVAPAYKIKAPRNARQVAFAVEPAAPAAPYAPYQEYQYKQQLNYNECQWRCLSFPFHFRLLHKF